MTSYIYLSDIHSNFEALKHLDQLPEMNDPLCEFRFGGDYIDGFNLEKDAVINTLRYIKNLCDRDKAKAIRGNHDQFIIDATYKPYSMNWWAHNGRKTTLENLNIPFRSESDLREQLLHFYKDEIDWLNSLPYYLEDHQNILVHAGFDLDLALKDQNPHEMLWVRSPYINTQALFQTICLHPDFHGKTLISGHTPTSLIHATENENQSCPILTDRITDKNGNTVTRYFIDGGSKSGSKKGTVNLLKLDETGKELWRAYLDTKGIHYIG